MARSELNPKDQAKWQAAWYRMEALGGKGVWDNDLVVMSFGGTSISDADLAVFSDFPFVRILDLSNTSIGDKGIAQLPVLPALEDLIVHNTKITQAALKTFQEQNPSVKIQTTAKPKDAINPFTGKPF